MSGTQPSQDVQDRVKAAFRQLMVLREGERTTVYLDTRRLPTVGIGHLVVPADNLRVGDAISEERVDELFAADSADALDAAWSQAEQAGITSSDFIPYLASVNFQLGTGWTGKFPNTWKMIEEGRYDDAANALGGTLWQQQTPTRVKDFQEALRALPSRQMA
jgi:GH24 family phage-related lysozyme (muramidase)